MCKTFQDDPAPTDRQALLDTVGQLVAYVPSTLVLLLTRVCRTWPHTAQVSQLRVYHELVVRLLTMAVPQAATLVLVQAPLLQTLFIKLASSLRSPHAQVVQHVLVSCVMARWMVSYVTHDPCLYHRVSKEVHTTVRDEVG